MADISDAGKQASEAPEALSLLLDMKAWSEADPPRDGWKEKQTHVVHLHPHVRMRISFEQSEVGYGLVRTEQLAEGGIFDAEHDSEQFVAKLLEAIGPELSRRNLQHLAAGIKKMQDDWK